MKFATLAVQMVERTGKLTYRWAGPHGLPELVRQLAARSQPASPPRRRPSFGREPSPFRGSATGAAPLNEAVAYGAATAPQQLKATLRDAAGCDADSAMHEAAADVPAAAASRAAAEAGAPSGEAEGRSAWSLFSMARRFVQLLVRSGTPVLLSEAVSWLLESTAATAASPEASPAMQPASAAPSTQLLRHQHPHAAGGGPCTSPDDAAAGQASVESVERRVYDIGTILASVGLVHRLYIQRHSAKARQPAFQWSGPPLTSPPAAADAAGGGAVGLPYASSAAVHTGIGAEQQGVASGHAWANSFPFYMPLPSMDAAGDVSWRQVSERL